MFVAKWYTRASRVRIVIAKFDGRWTIPGGPYPIPELVALVGGLLCTLVLLPRLGHPILTLTVGAAGTAAGVGVMRQMPYSPVPFGTRVHRVMRLYTNPTSTSNDLGAHDVDAVSRVRPRIVILDNLADPAPARQQTERSPAAPGEWDDLFECSRTPAAELFG